MQLKQDKSKKLYVLYGKRIKLRGNNADRIISAGNRNNIKMC